MNSRRHKDRLAGKPPKPKFNPHTKSLPTSAASVSTVTLTVIYMLIVMCSCSSNSRIARCEQRQSHESNSQRTHVEMETLNAMQFFLDRSPCQIYTFKYNNQSQLINTKYFIYTVYIYIYIYNWRALFQNAINAKFFKNEFVMPFCCVLNLFTAPSMFHAKSLYFLV